MAKTVGLVFEDNKELKLLNKDQLKEIATELGLEYDSKINKEDLISLIEDNQGEE